MYDSILVAADGSDDAGSAVVDAVELAGRLEVPLHAVAVIETRTAYDGAIVDREDVQARLRAGAETALESAAATATDAGVSIETALRTGVPHEEILEYAAEHDLSVIVVGSQGRSAFRRALLGSTADALVRLSPVPVLVVGDSDRKEDDE